MSKQEEAALLAAFKQLRKPDRIFVLSVTEALKRPTPSTPPDTKKL
jgi:hypothetical protein